MFDLENYNVILIVINILLKERYYILCLIDDEKILVKVTVNLLIKCLKFISYQAL